MNFALYIAKRYLFSKSSNNAINIMTIIAASGTIVASAALFIVLSGFAGLKEFSLQFSSYVDPDLKITPVKGKWFSLSETELSALNTLQDVASYSKIIEERAIVEFDDKRQIVTLKGVDENYTKVTAIDSMVIYGRWLESGTSQVVSGGGISNKLSLGVLDMTKRLTISVPKPGKGQITSVKSAFNSINAFNIGVFNINETLNYEYIYVDIQMVKQLLNYKPNQVSAIEFKLKPNTDEAEVIKALNTIFGSSITIKNRTQLNDALYKMLNTENVAVYLIFTLVIIIALFNVIGALIMMILDKKESLNTLFNLGATTKEIRRIFFLQGSLMTILGGLIGLVLGFIIVFLQKQFSLVMIIPSEPYPVVIKGINFLIVLATIFTLGILASKIASQRITKNLVKS
ncbi:FtsX-like permease family protein [uncultured Psychroserpens sp.]|uniref:ABC transporter permease n=1 Tax=uncultured Psychroserpens sp. TaxID=255436 RepID=UPI002635A74F|nr:FtsX-like permease family protein [uncultured Psychroserpens sp.]